MLIELRTWPCSDQNAERILNIKTNTGFFERVEEFKYLEMTLTIKVLFRKKLRAD
jgi:hypothetical protein